MSEPLSPSPQPIDPRRFAMSRRTVLRLGIAAVAATSVGSLLAACGSSNDNSTSASTASSGSSGGTSSTAAASASSGSGSASGTPSGSGSSTSEPANVVKGGELKWALSSDPPNQDPHISTGTAARAVKIAIYNGLARYWTKGEVSPDLATKWDISTDGLTYTFTLIDTTFHDGTPFTADDVKASIERIQDPKVGATQSDQMKPITSVTASDPRTAVFKLSAPAAALISVLALPECSIVSKKFLDGGGDPNKTMMGTGPFKFVSREPGVNVVVQKNDKFFREGKPYLDKITYLPYQNEDTRVAALKSGDVDIAEYIPWKDMDSIDKSNDLNLITTKGSSFMLLIYNTKQKPFDDAKVRHALGFAFDRDSIVQAAFFGRGEIITGGLITESSWAYNASLKDYYSYDPDKAKQLLSDAGQDPKSMKLTLMSTGQYGMHQSTGEVCQKNLQDLGIDCKLDLFDWATEVKKHTEGDYQFRVQGTSPDFPDPDYLTTFLYSSAVSQSRDSLSDQQFDQWLDQARQETDQAKRKELYNKIEERAADIAPYTLLCWRDDGYGTSKNVQGFEVLPRMNVFLSPNTLEQVWLKKS
ncbi:MAG TPA: ABC transporter substrate-binding protein [Nitrolancea sp.]